jgi:hypothetical protein
LDDEPKPSDSEKTECEKSIIRAKKKIKKLVNREQKGEELNKTEKLQKDLEIYLLQWKRAEWISKWGKKEKSPTFLFCGEQFNEGLSREVEDGERKQKKVESHNIIDFGQSENNKPEVLKKKLQEICKQNEAKVAYGESPVVWFKNIDKITNQEVKKELVKIVDPDQKNNLGKYYEEKKEKGKPEQIERTIDLSQFTLVATTSTANPKLPKELRAKLKHIEPFFDKYKWVIFFSSAGIEIIIFVLLIRSRRKSKNKSLKRLEHY